MYVCILIYTFVYILGVYDEYTALRTSTLDAFQSIHTHMYICIHAHITMYNYTYGLSACDYTNTDRIPCIWLLSQPDEAIAAFTEAMTVASNDEKHWLLSQRSRVYMSQNDAISAADDTAQCIQVLPYVAEGYERHCDALVAIGDLDSARACAHVGLMHSLNHKNDTLSRLLERISHGTMPKVAMARVWIKQLTKLRDADDLSRVILKWDKRLKKEHYPRIMEVWKRQLQAVFPQLLSGNNSPMSMGMSPLTKANSFRNTALKVGRRIGVMGALRLGGSKFDSTASSSDVSKSDSRELSMGLDHTHSHAPLLRTPSFVSSVGSVGIDDIKETVHRITLICKEFFKLSDCMNRELFLRMAVTGWMHIQPGAKTEDPMAQAALELQVGFALLEALTFAKSSDDFTEERACKKSFQHAIELLQGDEHILQRGAAWFGLAQAFKIRREGNHIQNFMDSAEYLIKSLSVITFEMDPHRFIAVHHEIGELYIEAGEIELANAYLQKAIKYLDQNGSAAWNTVSGIKFLRAQTHCKLAEACVKSNENLDPEHDPVYQQHVEKAMEHYETALQVYIIHLYPLEYARTYVRLCHLRGIAATNTIFHANGIVCLYNGQRSKLLQAYKGFQDALSTAEAIAMVMIVADDEAAAAVNIDRILVILSECFSGCIQTSIRLGMYAQALDYSERARGYAILRALLQEPCRLETLKGLPAPVLSTFKDLTKKLNKHRRALRLDVASTGNFSGMLHEAVQMVRLLNDMAAHAEICSNEKLALLGLTAPKTKEVPCVWLEDPVQDCETAFLEFYIGDSCAYAFLKCWKEDCPRTIEFTQESIKNIKAACAAVDFPDVKVRSICVCLHICPSRHTCSFAVFDCLLYTYMPTGARQSIHAVHGGDFQRNQSRHHSQSCAPRRTPAHRFSARPLNGSECAFQCWRVCLSRAVSMRT